MIHHDPVTNSGRRIGPQAHDSREHPRLNSRRSDCRRFPSPAHESSSPPCPERHRIHRGQGEGIEEPLRLIRATEALRRAQLRPPCMLRTRYRADTRWHLQTNCPVDPIRRCATPERGPLAALGAVDESLIERVRGGWRPGHRVNGERRRIARRLIHGESTASAATAGRDARVAGDWPGQPRAEQVAHLGSLRSSTLLRHEPIPTPLTHENSIRRIRSDRRVHDGSVHVPPWRRPRRSPPGRAGHAGAALDHRPAPGRTLSTPNADPFPSTFAPPIACNAHPTSPFSLRRTTIRNGASCSRCKSPRWETTSGSPADAEVIDGRGSMSRPVSSTITRTSVCMPLRAATHCPMARADESGDSTGLGGALGVADPQFPRAAGGDDRSDPPWLKIFSARSVVLKLVVPR